MELKNQILETLHAFVKQRPGLEFGNYGDVSAYRSEMRSITRDRHDAEVLMLSVRNSGITGEDLMQAFPRAYSGRLTCTLKDGKLRLDYCTGQYFPTEYRRAVCAVLASALWEYKRDHCMPKGELMHNSETGETLERYNGMRAGDYIRSSFKREFGARLANRWFN